MAGRVDSRRAVHQGAPCLFTSHSHMARPAAPTCRDGRHSAPGPARLPGTATPVHSCPQGSGAPAIYSVTVTFVPLLLPVQASRPLSAPRVTSISISSTCLCAAAVSDLYHSDTALFTTEQVFQPPLPHDTNRGPLPRAVGTGSPRGHSVSPQPSLSSSSAAQLRPSSHSSESR